MSAKMIVLTGGPLAGKTTVTNAITGEWPEKLVVMPEVATAILENLYPSAGKDVELWQCNLQRVILPTQLHCEAMHKVRAEEDRKRVVLCDRGILDGAAYMPGGPKRYFEEFDIDRQEQYAQYDSIIQLQSIATAAPHLWDSLKGTNPVRYETVEEAADRMGDT